MLLTCCILLFLAASNSFSNKNEEILLPSELKDNIDTRQFNGNSLWGYINGGADLYLEYGFKKINVHQFMHNNELIKIEIYEMNDFESAFGIFSVSNNKCNELELPSKFYCINNYHIQIARGKYYISIINESGKPETLSYCIELTKHIIIQINDDFILPDFISKNNTLINLNQLKLFKGELGLQNIHTNTINWIEFNSDYIAYYLSTEHENNNFEILSIKFKEERELTNFLINNVIKLNEKILADSDNKTYQILCKKYSSLELILLISEKDIDLNEIYAEIMNSNEH